LPFVVMLESVELNLALKDDPGLSRGFYTKSLLGWRWCLYFSKQGGPRILRDHCLALDQGLVGPLDFFHGLMRSALYDFAMIKNDNLVAVADGA
jgi:hypothetical protein